MISDEERTRQIAGYNIQLSFELEAAKFEIDDLKEKLRMMKRRNRKYVAVYYAKEKLKTLLKVAICAIRLQIQLIVWSVHNDFIAIVTTSCSQSVSQSVSQSFSQSVSPHSSLLFFFFQSTLLENETLVSMASGLLGYGNHDDHIQVMHKVRNVNWSTTRDM